MQGPGGTFQATVRRRVTEMNISSTGGIRPTSLLEGELWVVWGSQRRGSREQKAQAPPSQTGRTGQWRGDRDIGRSSTQERGQGQQRCWWGGGDAVPRSGHMWGNTGIAAVNVQVGMSKWAHPSGHVQVGTSKWAARF